MMSCIIPISDTQLCGNDVLGEHKVCREHIHLLHAMNDRQQQQLQELWENIWESKRQRNISEYNLNQQ